jgi:hypothetical protein
MSEALVRRFQQRIRREPTVDYLQEPPIRPRPPVTPDALREAEARLGFPLPPLLWELYTQVGDGGYGPGRGLHYLLGDDWSLVAHAERTCVAATAAGDPWWPPRLVEIVSWGGHYSSCVDCSGPPYPVWFYDNDCNVGDATQADYLYSEAGSLEGWLSAWLDGVDLWAIGPWERKHAEQDAAADRPREGGFVELQRRAPREPAAEIVRSATGGSLRMWRSGWVLVPTKDVDLVLDEANDAEVEISDYPGVRFADGEIEGSDLNTLWALVRGSPAGRPLWGEPLRDGPAGCEKVAPVCWEAVEAFAGLSDSRIQELAAAWQQAKSQASSHRCWQHEEVAKAIRQLKFLAQLHHKLRPGWELLMVWFV